MLCAGAVVAVAVTAVDCCWLLMLLLLLTVAAVAFGDQHCHCNVLNWTSCKTIKGKAKSHAPEEGQADAVEVTRPKKG